MAYGKRLKDFLHRSEESLRPVPKDLMSADEKELRQLEICRKSGKRWDEHTKALSALKVGDFVQLQNMTGHSPLKSDTTCVIMSNNGHSSYSVKILGLRTVTNRNRSTLRQIDPKSVSGVYDGIDSVFSIQGPALKPVLELTQQAVGEPGSHQDITVGVQKGLLKQKFQKVLSDHLRAKTSSDVSPEVMKIPALVLSS